MLFLSVPQAWHLVGTWSEQIPSESSLVGMGQNRAHEDFTFNIFTYFLGNLILLI